MPYCFLNWVPASDGHGLEPDCPDGLGARLLTGLQEVGWGIFDIRRDDSWSAEKPVDEQLADLIDSAKRYPPALAIAGHQMKHVFGDETPNQTDFARAYARELVAHLSKQQQDPYVLVRALKTGPHDMFEGEWYWVLRVTGSSPRATWVSGDCVLHDCDVNDFDLTGQQLKRLGFME